MSERANFGSKLGVILATAGSAVGLGNVWRFPYMTGQDGGAAFIMVYVLCVLLLGIPGMVAEFIVGRHGSANAAHAYRKMSGGGVFSFVGYMGVFTSMIILGFYAVVAGWCLQYLYASLAGHLSGDATYVTNYFVSFSTDAFKPLLWTVAFILITHFVIVRGVRNGIEKASKILMPVLFILLVVIVVASCMLPGAGKGVEFLLKPDFSKLTGGVFLDALGQAFFSLSLGTACLCTYASYFQRHTNLVRSAMQIAFIDMLIAMLAGLMIFPAAFSVGVEPDAGPSLIFITLPNVFQRAFVAMPVAGYVIAVLFYLLLALAALTSTISMHEIGTAFFREEFKISRSAAAWIVTAVCCLIGIICSLSVGNADISAFGKSVLDLCDYVTGQILLPLGSLFTCLLLGWFVPRNLVGDEITNWNTVNKGIVGVFLFLIRFVCPICIIAIFLHQMGAI